MASFNKLNGFVEHMAEKVHNLGADQLMIALSNVAPGSESTPPTGATGTNILANITQIDYSNLSPRAVSVASSAQSGGTYALALTDLVLSASGGSVGPFRYLYLFNDTPTSPADPLIGYWDYGSSLTLADGETLTLDFSASTISLS